jgi:hypothetical protein
MAILRGQKKKMTEGLYGRSYSEVVRVAFISSFLRSTSVDYMGEWRLQNIRLGVLGSLRGYLGEHTYLPRDAALVAKELGQKIPH